MDIRQIRSVCKRLGLTLEEVAAVRLVDILLDLEADGHAEQLRRESVVSAFMQEDKELVVVARKLFADFKLAQSVIKEQGELIENATSALSMTVELMNQKSPFEVGTMTIQ